MKESHADFASGAEQERNRRRSERRKGKVDMKRDFRHARTIENELAEDRGDIAENLIAARRSWLSVGYGCIVVERHL